MRKQLIADIGPNESRVALLEDGELAEIYIERPDIDRLVGNIYRGKVSSVLPGMQAAFVDIGHEKNAFLYAGDIIAGKEYSEDDDDHSHDAKGWNIADLVSVARNLRFRSQRTNRFQGAAGHHEYHAARKAPGAAARCRLHRGIRRIEDEEEERS